MERLLFGGVSERYTSIKAAVEQLQEQEITGTNLKLTQQSRTTLLRRKHGTAMVIMETQSEIFLGQLAVRFDAWFNGYI